MTLLVYCVFKSDFKGSSSSSLLNVLWGTLHPALFSPHNMILVYCESVIKKPRPQDKVFLDWLTAGCCHVGE